MSVLDDMRKYLDRAVASKRMRPGDKLPTYSELCEIFGITYTSAQRACKKLEQEGRIRVVNGVGSFLCGGETLAVEMILAPTTFDFARLGTLCREISDRLALNLEISISAGEPRRRREGPANGTRRVMIRETDSYPSGHGLLMDFSAFDDYEDLRSGMVDYAASASDNFQIPFYSYPYQFVINPVLMKEAGFSHPPARIENLDWWDELAACCRRHGVAPATMSFHTQNLFEFPPMMLCRVMALWEGRRDHPLIRPPFFATATGKRVFEIMDDFVVAPWDPPPFFTGRSAMATNLGSWAAVQYRRYGLRREQIRVAPVMSEGRKVVFLYLHYLQVFLEGTVTLNERHRVWTLIKELLSRPVQKQLMAWSGAVSVRRDLTADDHDWVDDGYFRDFFPGPEDRLLIGHEVSMPHVAVLRTLYEQYLYHGAASESIRRLMDEKLAIP